MKWCNDDSDDVMQGHQRYDWNYWKIICRNIIHYFHPPQLPCSLIWRTCCCYSKEEYHTNQHQIEQSNATLPPPWNQHAIKYQVAKYDDSQEICFEHHRNGAVDIFLWVSMFLSFIFVCDRFVPSVTLYWCFWIMNWSVALDDDSVHRNIIRIT